MVTWESLAGNLASFRMQERLETAPACTCTTLKYLGCFFLVEAQSPFHNSNTYLLSSRHHLTMSWRNQGITGSNNIPLGNRRRFGGDGNGDSQNDSPVDSPSFGDSGKRGRSPARGMLSGLPLFYHNTNGPQLNLPPTA